MLAQSDRGGARASEGVPNLGVQPGRYTAVVRGKPKPASRRAKAPQATPPAPAARRPAPVYEHHRAAGRSRGPAPSASPTTIAATANDLIVGDHRTGLPRLDAATPTSGSCRSRRCRRRTRSTSRSSAVDGVALELEVADGIGHAARRPARRRAARRAVVRGLVPIVPPGGAAVPLPDRARRSPRTPRPRTSCTSPRTSLRDRRRGRARRHAGAARCESPPIARSCTRRGRPATSIASRSPASAASRTDRRRRSTRRRRRRPRARAARRRQGRREGDHRRQGRVRAGSTAPVPPGAHAVVRVRGGDATAEHVRTTVARLRDLARHDERATVAAVRHDPRSCSRWRTSSRTPRATSCSRVYPEPARAVRPRRRRARPAHDRVHAAARARDAAVRLGRRSLRPPARDRARARAREHRAARSARSRPTSSRSRRRARSSGSAPPRSCRSRTRSSAQLFEGPREGEPDGDLQPRPVVRRRRRLRRRAALLGFPSVVVVLAVPGLALAARARRAAGAAATAAHDAARRRLGDLGASASSPRRASCCAIRTLRWLMLSTTAMAFAAGGYNAWLIDFLERRQGHVAGRGDRAARRSRWSARSPASSSAAGSPTGCARGASPAGCGRSRSAWR